MNNLKLFTIILTFIGFSTESSIGQKVDWIVQPVIDNVDNISLHKENVDYVICTKDRKKGIRTKDNDVILPIEYSMVQIWNDGLHFSGTKDKEQFFLDKDGYTIDFKEVDEIQSKLFYKNKAKKHEEAVVKLNADYPFLKFEVDDQRVAISNTSGEILVKDVWVLKSENFVGEKLFFCNDSDSTYLIDSEKGILHSFDGTHYNYDKKNNGFFTISKRKKTSYLFNGDGEVVCESEFVIREVLDKHKVFVGWKNKDESVILNFSGEPYFENAFKKVHKFYEIDDFLHLHTDTESFIYNFKDKSKFVVPEKSTYAGDFLIVPNDTLHGAIHKTTQEPLIPVEYRVLRYYDGFFITAAKKFKRNYKKPKASYLTQRKIINDKGEVIFDDVCKSIAKMNDYFLIYYENKTLLTDLEINTLMEFGETETVTRLPKYKGNWIGVKRNDKSQFFLTKQLLNGSKDSYERVNSKLYKSDSYPTSYIVTKDGKKGIITVEGKIIFPIEFESIESRSSKLIVKKDGKFGVAKRPK